MEQRQYSLPLHSPSLQPPSQYPQQQYQLHQQQQQQQNQGPPPYSAAFAESLTQSILSSSPHTRTNQTPSPISPSPIPFPVPLESPLRQYPSHLHPNLALTHPHGTLYGGPSRFTPHSLRAHAQDIAEIYGFESKQELEAYLLNELGKKGGELEIKLKDRQRMKENNERIEKSIRALEEERQVEIRMEERYRSERQKKGR